MEANVRTTTGRVAAIAAASLTVGMLALGGCTVNTAAPPPQTRVVTQPNPIVVQPSPNVTMVPPGSVVVPPPTSRTY